jgi:uncharacterized SAM-binding protein YcdF (DUF218 family)
MGFIAGKLLRIVLAPGNLAVLLLAWGMLRVVRSRGRRGLSLLVTVTAVLAAIAILPVGRWLAAPLETRFPIPALGARVDGIILLGGAIDARHINGGVGAQLNGAADRILAVLALARRYPQAKLLLVGGEGSIFPQGYSEAMLTRDLLVAQGLDPERMLVEARSRNTIENAIFAKAMAEPRASETWLLVTSAAHMPRAIGCFRHVGWDAIPFPTDFRGGGGSWDIALVPHLALVELAAREWFGLLGYRLLGRIDEVFPGPSP